jgi:hypothetical protein
VASTAASCSRQVQMLLPQQGQQDCGYLDHEQQYAQPSDHLAYRFWVPHKETDVGEEEAHGYVVDAGRELPAQDAPDSRQAYCDEHRRRGRLLLGFGDALVRI